MPLKAKLDGREIVSVHCSDAAWEAAQEASKGDGGRLRMPCCDAPAYATHSPLGLRYFAHKVGSEHCHSGGESEEHESLKAAAAIAVNACSGWNAKIEVSGEGWRADVLAVRRSQKIAIEVQLSSQAKRETAARNNRFEASEVTPFWLKGRRNHENDFGAGLQEPVLGKDIMEQMDSVRTIVGELLGKIERQVGLANNLTRLVKSIPGWTYRLEKQGTIPACFELSKEGKQQQILLGELGPALLPTVFRPIDGRPIGADQFAGAILQLRVNSLHLPGYQSSSFKIDVRNIVGDMDRLIRPILEGKKKWQGKEHTEDIPVSFIHYHEDCSNCNTRYLRITHLLIGNPKHPKTVAPKLRADWNLFSRLLSHAELLAEGANLPLGPLSGETYPGAFGGSPSPTQQSCPKCRAVAPPPLFSDDEVLRCWDNRKAHFLVTTRVPGTGWGSPTEWVERVASPSTIWTDFVEQRRAETERTRETERKMAEARAAERKREAEERRLRQVEERLRREEKEKAQKEEQRRRDEAARKKRDEEMATDRCLALICAAEKHIDNPDRRRTWLHSYNPKLRLQSSSSPAKPWDGAAESDNGLKAALELLGTIKS